MSGFYNARADALALSGGRIDVDLHRLIQSFSPQAVDFGKAPSNPIDRLWDTLETLAKNFRGNRSD
jgi:hypothetical protein